MLIRCPHCGTELEIGDEYAGQKGRCDQCNQAFLIPDVSPAPAPKPAPAAVTPRQPFPLFSVLGAVLFVAVALGFAWYTLRDRGSPAPVAEAAPVSPSHEPAAEPVAARTPETVPAAQPVAEVARPAPRQAPEPGADFSLASWKAKYGARIDLAAWRKNDPYPWGTYFDANSDDCAKNWFFQLGPLGARVAWRDCAAEWMNMKAFAPLFPSFLRDGKLGLANAIEVLDVQEGGPAAGHLQPGDLIVEIDGQPIRSSSYTFLDRTLAVRDTRGLEIHAGQLVDAAEGRGSIAMKVLRLADIASKPQLPAGLEEEVIPATATATAKPVTLDVRGFKAVTIATELTTGGNGTCWVNLIEPRFEGPAGPIALTNLVPVEAANGWGTMRSGADVGGGRVRLAGREIDNVIGGHANHSLVYVVPEGATTLNLTVQYPQNNAGMRTVIRRHRVAPRQQLVVLGSQSTTNGTIAPIALDVPVPGGSVLALIANGGTDGTEGDTMRLDALELREAGGRTIKVRELPVVFSSVGPDPLANVSAPLTAPCQIELMVPAGRWTLRGTVAPSTRGALTCTVGCFPPLALPDTLKPYVREVSFAIPRIGSFGGRVDPDGAKLRNIAALMAERLAAQQKEDGSWESVPGSYSEPAFHGSMAGLGLLSTGDKAYDDNIRRAAHWVAGLSGKPGDSDWCYPQGVKLMFLSEYFLRTKDPAVMPAIQALVDRCVESCLTFDSVAGHKVGTPGYGGSGWIGATGPIALGLVTASRTTARVPPEAVNSLLARIQELSLTAGGNLPYGRSLGRTSKPAKLEKVDTGKAWGAGNGTAVIASFMGGGGDLYVDYSRERFTKAPWGDEDGGHASHTLPYIWTSLACALFGGDARQGNLDAHAWRITLFRDFAGFVNNNTDRLEYRGAEGVIGKPYWSTGGFLLVLNAGKRNLLCTGLDGTRIAPRELPYAQSVDRAFRQATLNDWNLAEAVLGSRMPPAGVAALKKLRALPDYDPALSRLLFEFLRTDAPPVAREVLKQADLPPLARGWLAEMLLGVRDRSVAGERYFQPKDVKAEGRVVPYLYNPQLLAPELAWTGQDVGFSNDWNGTVTVTDLSGRHLPKPAVVTLAPGKKPAAITLNLPTNAFKMAVDYDYTQAGVHVQYRREVEVNPTNDAERSRGFWVRGTLLHAEELKNHWRVRIRLSNGQVLEATRRESREIWFRNPDGSRVPLRTKEAEFADGKIYEFLVPGAWDLGEVPLYEVRLPK